MSNGCGCVNKTKCKNLSDSIMSNLVQVSLILCTLGRVKEVNDFLESLVGQTLHKNYFEVIVCDQNADGRLNEVIRRYAKLLNLRHIRSTVKGLSVNRNIGMKCANGLIMAFPDDDCIYYDNTLENVVNKFKEMPDGVLLGRIYDKSLRRDILKSWPCKSSNVNIYNFYSLTTSITIFSKKCEILFNEKFGVGAQYSSNEDTLYVLENLLKSNYVIYVPDVEVWHPEQKNTKMRIDRIISYGIGFGKMLRIMPMAPKAYYYALFNAYYLISMIKAIVIFDMYRVKWAYYSLLSRNRAFFQSDTN